jgi:hypothetical protein
MTYRPPDHSYSAGVPLRSDAGVLTYADWAVRRARDLEEQRQFGLSEQASLNNSPSVRIRAWEKVHKLRMPGDPQHRVLRVIAAATGLTAEQVREEQLARKVPAVS